MSHGGARPGSGRKPGASTKLNEAARKKALEGGVSPLDYILGLMRDDKNPADVRFEAAKAAAPFVHAKLAAVEHSGDMTMRHEEALEQLDEEGEGDTPEAPGRSSALLGKMPQNPEQVRKH